MKRVLRNWLVLMFAMTTMVLLSCGTVWAAKGNTVVVNVPVTYGQTEARKMFDLINEFRTGSEAWYWNKDNQTKTICTNLTELEYDYELEEIAMKRAAEIAVSYGHERPNGQNCFSAYNSYSAAGENIAAGYTSYTSVFEGWKETDDDYEGQDHRRDMLDENFTAVGIGHVYYKGYHYWVQEFRAPKSSKPKTAANDALTNVDVEVLAGNIVSVTSSVSEYNLDWSSGEELPELLITLKGSWPADIAGPVNSSEDWAIEDTACVSISGNELVGKAIGSTNLTAAAAGKTITIPVTVSPVSLKSATVLLSKTSYYYTGSNNLPSVTVTMDGKILTSSDYDILYTNSIKPGAATVTVTGKGLYTDSVSRTYAIICTHLSSDVVTDEAVAATCTETGLTEGSHCSACHLVLVAQMTTDKLPHAETRTVTRAKVGSDGKIVTTCRECNQTLGTQVIGAPKSLMLSTTAYTYNDKAENAFVKLIDSAGKVMPVSSYTVKYISGRKNAGKYKVTVRLKGNYSGTLSKIFTLRSKSIRRKRKSAEAVNIS